MPIVDVEIVVTPQETLRRVLASELADAIGDALGTPKGRTWVRVRTLSRSLYAEHGGMSDDVQPVFVTVLKSQRPSGAAIQDEVSRLTGVVAEKCGRSIENVHILYEADAKGRIAFGGTVVE